MKPAVTRSAQRRFCLLILGAWWVLSACASGSGTLSADDSIDRAPLPEDIASLHNLVDKKLESSLPSTASIALANRALSKAVALEAEPSFESVWRMAKVGFHLANSTTSKYSRLEYASKGLANSKQAQKQRPDRVEGHYYYALNTALIAEARAEKALVELMMEAGYRAAELDPGFDHAGPLRFLGKVLITAPGWPTSVGSPEKGVETLERALTLSKTFLNRLFLAEACYHDEQYDRARALFRELQDDPATSNEPARWREELEKYVALLREDQEGEDEPEL